MLEEPWPPVQPAPAASDMDPVLVNGLGMSFAVHPVLEVLESIAGHAAETVGCWISPKRPGSSILPVADDLQPNDSTPKKDAVSSSSNLHLIFANYIQPFCQWGVEPFADLPGWYRCG